MGVDVEMYVRTPKRISDDEILTLSVRLCEALGTETFFLVKKEDDFGYTHHALSRVTGEDEEALILGQHVIQVHFSGRYYGPGYERGSLPHIIFTAEFLERNLQGSEVYYCGDSGDRPELFDKAAREKLIQHWAMNGGIPYYGTLDGKERNPFMPPDPIKWPFCDFCQVTFRRYGYGPKYGMFICAGCRKRLITQDNGETFTEGKEE